MMNQLPETTNEKPVYQIKKSWLGISDWILDKVGVRPATWEPILKVFNLIKRGSKYMDKPVFGPIYKRLMKFTPEESTYSHGTILNLNVDVSEKGESVVLPIDLVKDLLRKADFIASTNSCICRSAANCTEFPKDVCCIFMGDSGRTIVKHQIGYEIDLAQALERVDKAAELGLIGQALWVEVEQYIWGLSNKTMGSFLELCFCCPCCCVALTLSKNASRDVKKRFTSSGWMAVVDDERCSGCSACIDPCPQAAITLSESGKAMIDHQYCVGCGICKTHCSSDAIQINQVRPMLGSVNDYLLTDGRLDLKL